MGASHNDIAVVSTEKKKCWKREKKNKQTNKNLPFCLDPVSSGFPELLFKSKVSGRINCEGHRHGHEADCRPGALGGASYGLSQNDQQCLSGFSSKIH